MHCVSHVAEAERHHLWDVPVVSDIKHCGSGPNMPVMIIWSIRRKIIGTALCCILYRSCVQSCDMSINVRKSCSMRIGTRHDKPCSKIITSDGQELVWADKIRYLSVFSVRATKLKCFVDQAKWSFFMQTTVHSPRMGDRLLRKSWCNC